MNVIEAIAKETGLTVTRETTIRSLGLDSLELAELLMLLDVPVEKVADLNTVDDLIREAQ